MLRKKECFNSERSGNVLSYTQGGEGKKRPITDFCTNYIQKSWVSY